MLELSKSESDEREPKPVFHPTNGREGETATFLSNLSVKL